MDERTPFNLSARGSQYRLTWQRVGQARPRSKMFRRYQDAERRLARYRATVDLESGRGPIVYSRIDARRVTPWELGEEVVYENGVAIEQERLPCRICGADGFLRARAPVRHVWTAQWLTSSPATPARTELIYLT
jgi:hypothetical protein